MKFISWNVNGIRACVTKGFLEFFKEVKSELKKVVWPSRKQVVNNTLIVLALVILIGLFIFGLDTLFNWGLLKFVN